MSRLLLENSNQLVNEIPGTSQDVQVPEWNQDGLLIEWKTPQKSVNV